MASTARRAIDRAARRFDMQVAAQAWELKVDARRAVLDVPIYG
ncbi:hypothetical protein [Cupriavidus sp. YR651]|nr:hypothetical protein [Cupriavidus sp. YR651]